MAMDYAGEISALSSKLAGIEEVLDTEGMRKEADGLRERASDPTLWEDQENAPGGDQTAAPSTPC